MAVSDSAQVSSLVQCFGEGFSGLLHGGGEQGKGFSGLLRGGEGQGEGFSGLLQDVGGQSSAAVSADFSSSVKASRDVSADRYYDNDVGAGGEAAVMDDVTDDIMSCSTQIREALETLSRPILAMSV